MFDKQYVFKGAHALKVDRLTAQFDENSKAKMFSRNVDIYVMAPIIGYLYGRQASLDTSTPETQNVMGDRVIYSQEDLKYNYRLIMLLDTKYEPDAQKRIDKAFRVMGTSAAVEDEALFDRYVRGGVDVLYEKLIDGASNADEYVEHLYDFLEEFEERFNENITAEGVVALCQQARE